LPDPLSRHQKAFFGIRRSHRDTFFIMKSFFARQGAHLLFSFLRDRWRAVLPVFFLDFFANTCVIGISLLLAQTAAALFGFRSVRGGLLGIPIVDVGALLAWLGAVIVAKFLLDQARLRLRGYLTEDFSYHLRTLAFEQHLRADIRWHENRDSGKSLLRFSGDLGSAQRLLARGVFQYAADCALLLMALSLVAWLDGRLAFFVGGLTAAGWFLTHRINLRLRRIEVRRRGKKARLLAFVSAMLLQLPGIQALNRSTRTAQRFGHKAEQVRTLGRQYHRLAAVSEALPLFFVQMLLFVVLVLGWWFGLSGEVLFVVILVLMSWRSPLARLLKASLIWKKGLLSLEKMDSLLRSPVTMEGKFVLEKKCAHTLRLREVTLRFGKKTVFENLSFQLSVGEMLRLPLRTGGGKTALVKLLAGLYRPDSGTMEWDGEAAEKFTAHSLRRQIAFVSEAFPLSGASLLDALSNSGQAEAIAKTKVEFRHWQTLFPALQHLDFQQKITERTPALSTGQQCLLQCLRAMLADKPFLVLDEPFAGLDTETAKALGAILEKYGVGKGVLLLTTQEDL
jgi:ABC-type multidrug transport system fused ATPase/permease subunit